MLTSSFCVLFPSWNRWGILLAKFVDSKLTQFFFSWKWLVSHIFNTLSYIIIIFDVFIFFCIIIKLLLLIWLRIYANVIWRYLLVSLIKTISGKLLAFSIINIFPSHTFLFSPSGTFEDYMLKFLNLSPMSLNVSLLFLVLFLDNLSDFLYQDNAVFIKQVRKCSFIPERISVRVELFLT